MCRTLSTHLSSDSHDPRASMSHSVCVCVRTDEVSTSCSSSIAEESSTLCWRMCVNTSQEARPQGVTQKKKVMKINLRCEKVTVSRPGEVTVVVCVCVCVHPMPVVSLLQLQLPGGISWLVIRPSRLRHGSYRMPPPTPGNQHASLK